MADPEPTALDTALREIHRNVLDLAESLEEAQLRWRPEGHATSIAWHLWHLARESDNLRAVLCQRVEQLGPDFGPTDELWDREGLAAAWGFPAELFSAVGSGLTDDAAANLPLAPKAELVRYLRTAYAELESFLALLDARYPACGGGPVEVDPALAPRLPRIRMNVLGFLTHDCRHLGMMEVLKGLQTGFGSATETR